MVPKVAPRGSSFKAAGAYYLHDKKAQTAERVAFTHTENLPVTDPERALDCMAYTAMHQNEIKAASGMAKTGRKLTLPVYTYSLAWAPDETPSQEEMIEAGRETLKALGLEDHEVLMVAHSDEPHPHLHLIVNRVHPETGRAATLSNDHLTLSRWAEAYEKKQGEIRCEQRVENNEKRRKGEFVKDRKSLDVSRLRSWRRERLQRAYAARQAEAKNLSAAHRGERHALHKAKEADIRLVLADERRRNRPYWSEISKRQWEEKRALNEAQKTAYMRLRFFLKERAPELKGQGKGAVRRILREAVKAVIAQDNPHGAQYRKHMEERKALARELKGRVIEASRVEVERVERRYEREFARLEVKHLQERARLTQEHARQSYELARGIKEGRIAPAIGQEDKARGQSGNEAFNRRVQAQLKKTKKRREEERKRGKDYGRERE